MFFFTLEVNRRTTTSISIKFLGSRVAAGDEVSRDEVLSEEELILCVLRKYSKANKITLDLKKWQVWESLNDFDWQRFCDLIFSNLTCLVKLEICGNGSVKDEIWESLIIQILSASPTLKKRLRSLSLINVGNTPLTYQRIGSFSSLEELRLTYSARRGTSISSDTCSALVESFHVFTNLKRLELSGFMFSSAEESASNNRYFPLIKALSTMKTLEHVELGFYVVDTEVGNCIAITTLTPEEEEMINFFPRINKAGYSSLLENVEASTASDWVDVLVGLHDHLDSLYYVLRTTDPSRLAKAVLNEERNTLIQYRAGFLSQHFAEKSMPRISDVRKGNHRSIATTKSATLP